MNTINYLCIIIINQNKQLIQNIMKVDTFFIMPVRLSVLKGANLSKYDDDYLNIPMTIIDGIVYTAEKFNGVDKCESIRKPATIFFNGTHYDNFEFCAVLSDYVKNNIHIGSVDFYKIKYK